MLGSRVVLRSICAAVAVSACLLPATVSAQEDTSPHSTVEIFSAGSRIKPGGSIVIGLQFRLDPGWHIYWKNPGDSGLPPAVEWDLPDGFEVESVRWPTPHRVTVGGIVNFVHEGEPSLLFRMRVPKDFKLGTRMHISADVNYLVCEELCLTAFDSVVMPLDESHFVASQGVFLDTRVFRPSTYPKEESLSKLVFSQQEGIVELGFELRDVSPGEVKSAYFFAVGKEVLDHAAEQKWRFDGNVISLTAKISKYADGRIKKPEGVLVVQLKDRTVAIEFTKQQDSEK